MRKTYLPLTILCLIFSFLLLPVVRAGGNAKAAGSNGIVANTNEVSNLSAEAFASKLYDSLQLDEIGMSRDAITYAIKGHRVLAKKGQLKNEDILTVVDFSQPSSKKRLYILDVKNYEVLINTYVAHGKNSGLQMAEKFSNKIESLQSSLGFYVTTNTYFGKHGLSLRLSGKDKGFNDNAERRAVVVHGAQYIGSNRASAAFMGRSFGCPAVPQAISAKVINTIKNGTALFVYHPSKSYLHGSTILNG